MPVKDRGRYDRRMRVAVLTDSIDADAPGFASYASHLARGLIEGLPGRVTLVHRSPDGFYDGLPQAIPAISHRWLPARLARQYALPRWLETQGFDLVHDTYHFGPFLRPSSFARVLTIGALTPIVAVGAPASARLAHRFLLPAIAGRAHRIVTFSENSRRDIERILHVRPAAIAVTPLASSEAFYPREAAEIQEARARLGLPERYLLYVGSIEPRKNVERLVRAFARAKPHLDGAHLVLAGRRMWGMSGFEDLITHLGIRDRVSHRRDINNEDLPLVYTGAIALAYPSLYEGFGLPALEAMQCGTAVVTSNSSSLPEVVGDAAVLVDPQSVDDIARGLIAVTADSLLRGDLSSRGRERAQQFSWSRCAELTIAAYNEALRIQAAR